MKAKKKIVQITPIASHSFLILYSDGSLGYLQLFYPKEGLYPAAWTLDIKPEKR